MRKRTNSVLDVKQLSIKRSFSYVVIFIVAFLTRFFTLFQKEVIRGYRAKWDTLHLDYGIQAPRRKVEIILRQVGLEGLIHLGEGFTLIQARISTATIS